MCTLILPKILKSVTHLAHNQTDVVKQSLKKSVFNTISCTDSVTAIFFWTCIHCVSIWIVCLFIKYLHLKRGSDMISKKEEKQSIEIKDSRSSMRVQSSWFFSIIHMTFNIQKH